MALHNHVRAPIHAHTGVPYPVRLARRGVVLEPHRPVHAPTLVQVGGHSLERLAALGAAQGLRLHAPIPVEAVTLFQGRPARGYRELHTTTHARVGVPFPVQHVRSHRVGA
jgi:hypothetical protein